MNERQNNSNVFWFQEKLENVEAGMDQVQDAISKTDTLLLNSEKKLKELTKDDTEVNPYKEKLDKLQEKFRTQVPFIA